MNVEVTTLTPKQIWQLNSNTASAWINYAEELESIGKISEAFTIFEAALVSPQITSKVRLAERYAEL
ncbi:hypothetical protein DDN27_003591, partial [Vibrio cholerae]